MISIYLSGGGEKQKFAGYKNKGEVQTFLKEKYDVSFPTHGKVDVIIIPNEVSAPSTSALKKYANEKTRVFNLEEFIAWKKRRTFASIEHKKNSHTKKQSEKKDNQTTKSNQGKKASKKNSHGKKHSKKLTKKKKTKKQTSVTKETKELLLWHSIVSLKWTTDHNVERVKKQLATWPLTLYRAVDNFVFEKVEELMKQMKLPHVSLSVFAEIVAMGKSSYENITKRQLQSMAKQKPEFNFEFCFDRE